MMPLKSLPALTKESVAAQLPTPIWNEFHDALAQRFQEHGSLSIDETFWNESLFD